MKGAGVGCVLRFVPSPHSSQWQFGSSQSHVEGSSNSRGKTDLYLVLEPWFPISRLILIHNTRFLLKLFYREPDDIFLSFIFLFDVVIGLFASVLEDSVFKFDLSVDFAYISIIAWIMTNWSLYCFRHPKISSCRVLLTQTVWHLPGSFFKNNVKFLGLQATSVSC